jgi:hypothetical protein
MQAVAAVIQERGYEAATMAEIAARADARIGSLSPLLPEQRGSGPTLSCSDTPKSCRRNNAIHARAAVATPEELADTLIDLFLKLYPQSQAATVLLRPDGAPAMVPGSGARGS